MPRNKYVPHDLLHPRKDSIRMDYVAAITSTTREKLGDSVAAPPGASALDAN